MKDAMRNKSATLVAIAADEPSATKCLYDWSYNYNSTTDTYTFYNNAPIAMGATFAGSFEIVWNIKSRESKHNVSFSRTATLTARNDKVTSNTINYNGTRTKDDYTISIKASRVSSPEGYEPYLPASDQNPDNYKWVKYRITGTKILYARGIDSAEKFYLWVPTGAEIINSTYTKTTTTGSKGTLWVATRSVSEKDSIW